MTIRPVACLTLGMTLAFASLAAAQSPRRPTPAPQPRSEEDAKEQEARILGQVRAIEAQLAREEQILRAQLERAQQMREQGLKTTDGQMLQRAEQLERAAFERYNRQMQLYERSIKGVGEGESQQPSERGARPAPRSQAPRRAPRTQSPPRRPAPSPENPEKNTEQPRRPGFFRSLFSR